jgi:pseudaminic acid biosynthesis-associated methylase
MKTDQIKVWTSSFGQEYNLRNIYESIDDHNNSYLDFYGKTKDDLNKEILSFLPKDLKILEIGSNVGYQLASLQRFGFSNLFGIEIQRECVDRAKHLWTGIDIIDGSGFDIPFKSNYFDLVFTNNVLIHISPKDIDIVLSEMYRVSSKYIYGFEYFSENYEKVEYRNHKDLLWKTDFENLFLQKFHNLKSVFNRKYKCLNFEGNTDKAYILEKE